METKKSYSKEIAIPEGVTINFSNGLITVKHKNNEISRPFNLSNEQIRIDNGKLAVQAKKQGKAEKKAIGSLIAHVKNMLTGVTLGHKYVLKICSGHFPMEVSVNNNQLIVKNFFGERVPRVFDIKPGIKVTVNNDRIYVESHNKELASQASADVEQLMRRPGFDARVFQDGIYLVNKDGKELK